MSPSLLTYSRTSSRLASRGGQVDGIPVRPRAAWQLSRPGARLPARNSLLKNWKQTGLSVPTDENSSEKAPQTFLPGTLVGILQRDGNDSDTESPEIDHTDSPGYSDCSVPVGWRPKRGNVNASRELSCAKYEVGSSMASELDRKRLPGRDETSHSRSCDQFQLARRG